MRRHMHRYAFIHKSLHRTTLTLKNTCMHVSSCTHAHMDTNTFRDI